MLTGQEGASLPLLAEHAGARIGLAETLRQGDVEAVRLAAEIVVPLPETTPEPATEAPTLSGGGLHRQGDDLVAEAPSATGSPLPAVTMSSLTRDGIEILASLVNGRIIRAAPGQYTATWTASNGTPPDAVLTRALTIAAPSSDIVLTTPDAEIEVAEDASGTTVITISGTGHYDGTYSVTNADLDEGPVCIVPPAVSGLPVEGTTVTAIPGLWASRDSDGVISYPAPGQWQADGVAISGETGLTLTVTSALTTSSLTYLETATNTAGTRTQVSNAINSAATGLDTFTAPDGTLLSDYIGESGETWSARGAKVTITDGKI